MPLATEDKNLAGSEKERQGNNLTRKTSDVDEMDSAEPYQVKARDNNITRTGGTDTPSSGDSPELREIIYWDDGDPDNPYNWNFRKKAFITMIGMIVVLNSTLGSSLPSNTVPFISKEFGIKSSAEQILPMSVYLIGFIPGPLFFGPLSETCGRKMIVILTFVLYAIFTMACALAPTYVGLLMFRLLAGINASSPIAVIGGVYADLYSDPVSRGRAVALFMTGTCIGPIVAPIISGFVSPILGWRWSFWIGLMFAGASLSSLFFLPETFGPVLLARRAQKLRRSTGKAIFAPIELEKTGFKQMVTVTLTRPLRMIFYELIVSATCVYTSLVYGIFYMYFETYDLIFQGIYKMTPGVAGLMFLPILGGAVIGSILFLYYDNFLRNAQQQQKSWTRREEARRLPLACFGGPFIFIALFWLAWTSREDIPFYVPMLAGIPFGVGYLMIFMSLINYLTDAYEIFAASAIAASSCCRSLAAAALPFASAPMYQNLGVTWASSLLGFLSLGMCAIPFLFLWKGNVLRERSEFCTYLRDKKEKEQVEAARERKKRVHPTAASELVALVPQTSVTIV